MVRQVLGDEEGILLCRACRESIDGERKIVLAVLPAAGASKSAEP